MSEHHSKKRKLEASTSTDAKLTAKPSKEERRAAKKAKKQGGAQIAVEAPRRSFAPPATISDSHGQNGIAEAAATSSIDDDAAKAARKARKAEKAASKKGSKDQAAKAARKEKRREKQEERESNGIADVNGALVLDAKSRAQREKEARTRMILNGIGDHKRNQNGGTAKPAGGELDAGRLKLEGQSNAQEESNQDDGSDEEEREINVPKHEPRSDLNGDVKMANTDGSGTIDSDSSEGKVVQAKQGKERKRIPNSKKKASYTYEISAALKSLPQQSLDDFTRLNHIKVSDPTANAGASRPILDFKYLPDTIRESKAWDAFKPYKSPTPIQAASWPYLMSGRDVVGIAETGSGKTLAFGLACVMTVKRNQPADKNQIMAVIVSPTRELALQIHDQLHPLAKAFQLKTVCVYGGVPKDPQREALRNSHIVVATPGRLMDFCEEKSAKLKHAKYVVLDEADRMLDQGFKDAIQTIMSKCANPRKRQTAMFTATWPQSVRELASTYLSEPVQINIGAHNPNAELRANKNVVQTVEVLDSFSKEGRLRELIREYSPSNSNNRHLMSDNRILIFCLYKKECERVERSLRKMLSGAVKGIGAIHGDMSQAMRTTSLSEFKKGNITILVATDVAARGLDIPDVKIVINYTFPLTAEDYVHRIGRTGRAGKEGIAVTLFTDADKHMAGELVNVLRAADQEVPEELLRYDLTVKKKEHSAYGKFFREVREGEKSTGTKTTFD